jgi:hypothetical protein
VTTQVIDTRETLISNQAPILTTGLQQTELYRENIVTESAPVVIRHDEAPVVTTNVSTAQVFTHTEAPIVKTIIEQPIIKAAHREVIHEHHQQVVNEHHREVIHEHHRPVIHEHIQPVIYQEHIHEKHVPIIHEKQKEIIHEKHVNLTQEQHERRITEEHRGAIVTESQAAPIVTKEIAQPIVEKEILESRTQVVSGTTLATGRGSDIITEERFLESTNLNSGLGLGHEHIDTYETDAYGTQKRGFGQKIKKLFRRKNKNEEEFEGVTYGPNGERIVEKHTYQETYK